MAWGLFLFVGPSPTSPVAVTSIPSRRTVSRRSSSSAVPVSASGSGVSDRDPPGPLLCTSGTTAGHGAASGTTTRNRRYHGIVASGIDTDCWTSGTVVRGCWELGIVHCRARNIDLGVPWCIDNSTQSPARFGIPESLWLLPFPVGSPIHTVQPTPSKPWWYGVLSQSQSDAAVEPAPRARRRPAPQLICAWCPFGSRNIRPILSSRPPLAVVPRAQHACGYGHWARFRYSHRWSVVFPSSTLARRRPLHFTAFLSDLSRLKFF